MGALALGSLAAMGALALGSFALRAFIGSLAFAFALTLPLLPSDPFPFEPLPLEPFMRLELLLSRP